MTEFAGKLNATGLKMAIVVSRFNQVITEHLLEGALEMIERTGGVREEVAVFRVPGSFEIPFAARQLVLSNSFDAVICLGSLIRGETDHYQVLASEVTRGIMQVCLLGDVPVTFGVITAETVEQAMNRAGIKSGNKGAEAALAAIEMACLKRHLHVSGGQTAT